MKSLEKHRKQRNFLYTLHKCAFARGIGYEDIGVVEMRA